MSRFDPLENLMSAASAHVFTDGELRALAMRAIGAACEAIEKRQYNVGLAAIDEAQAHLRALRDKKVA
jgi:hypothetical protein